MNQIKNNKVHHFKEYKVYILNKFSIILDQIIELKKKNEGSF